MPAVLTLATLWGISLAIVGVCAWWVDRRAARRDARRDTRVDACFDAAARAVADAEQTVRDAYTALREDR